MQFSVLVSRAYFWISPCSQGEMPDFFSARIFSSSQPDQIKKRFLFSNRSIRGAKLLNWVSPAWIKTRIKSAFSKVSIAAANSSAELSS
jgi:hypothetical protein